MKKPKKDKLEPVYMWLTPCLYPQKNKFGRLSFEHGLFFDGEDYNRLFSTPILYKTRKEAKSCGFHDVRKVEIREV